MNFVEYLTPGVAFGCIAVLCSNIRMLHKISKQQEAKMLHLEQQIQNVRFEKDISSLKSQIEDLKSASTELCKDT